MARSGREGIAGMKQLPKDLRVLIRAAMEAGWTVQYSGSGHLKWYAPDGTYRFASASTPRNAVRQIQSVKQDLRRHGTVL